MTVLLWVPINCAVTTVADRNLPLLFAEFDLVAIQDLKKEEANGTKPTQFASHNNAPLEKPKLFEINKAYTFHLPTDKQPTNGTFELFKTRLLSNGYTITREHEGYLFVGEKYSLEFKNVTINGRLSANIDFDLYRNEERPKNSGIQDYILMLYQ